MIWILIRPGSRTRTQSLAPSQPYVDGGDPAHCFAGGSSLAVPRHIESTLGFRGAARQQHQHQHQPASKPVPREKKTNKPKSLLFFLFPPRLGEKSAVETLFTYFPTRTSEAGESHGRRYTVGSRTHARPGPSGTGTLRLGRPLVRTHVVFSFSALQKGTLGHSGRGQGVSGTRRQVWCQCCAPLGQIHKARAGGGVP